MARKIVLQIPDLPEKELRDFKRFVQAYAEAIARDIAEGANGAKRLLD